MRRELPQVDRRAAALCAAGALAIGALVAAGLAGFRFNDTESMPAGIWRVTAAADTRRGDVVTICAPDVPSIRQARERGYIGPGICANGAEPLVKPVAAVPGDLVTVAREGVAVNGEPVERTAQLEQDGAGRPLHGMAPGSYRVAPGQVWLLSGYDTRSFDSRYFGAVPVANVLGRTWPVWVAR